MAVGAAVHIEIQELKRPPSLTAMVTDQLRDMIISNAFRMGEQLSENLLSSRLGVSRTPVREACLALQNERLLEIRPKRGMFVFKCTVNQIHDICELREIIEVSALRLGMKRAPEKLLGDYRQALTACNAAIDAPGRFQSSDHDLHAVIVRSSENPELIDAYHMASGRARALRYRYARTTEEFSKSQADHEEIYRLLVAGEFDSAVRVLSHHVYGSLEKVKKIMAADGLDDIGAQIQ